MMKEIILIVFPLITNEVVYHKFIDLSTINKTINKYENKYQEHIEPSCPPELYRDFDFKNPPVTGTPSTGISFMVR